MFFDKCEIVQISIRQNQSVVTPFFPKCVVARVNTLDHATSLKSPLRRSSMNDFDVAKIRIYLQSAKQIPDFLQEREYYFYEDTFIGYRRYLRWLSQIPSFANEDACDGSVSHQ